MSPTTEKAKIGRGAMPPTEIYPWTAAPSWAPGWRCDIDEGPGYHGVGSTRAEALFNAARAWLKGGKK